jgi:excisionase family DNA binding protein
MRAKRIHRAERAGAAGVTDPLLSIQEAADLVEVSRHFMRARIDAGDVPLHRQVGDERRVLRSSVLAWHQRHRASRRRALGRLGASLDGEIFSD